MAIDFNNVFAQLKTDIENLAKSSFTIYSTQAIADGNQLLNLMKADLTRWTQELIEGQITTDDLKTLVIGDKDLAAMTSLTEAGLALAAIDQFRVSVLNLITNSIIGLI